MYTVAVAEPTREDTSTGSNSTSKKRKGDTSIGETVCDISNNRDTNDNSIDTMEKSTESSLRTVKKKECEKDKSIYTYSHPNIDITQPISVQGEQEESMESTFMCQSEINQNQEERMSENEIMYALECVEFLDTLNFDDDTFCDDDVDYVDE